jgi:putative flippase GtrA
MRRTIHKHQHILSQLMRFAIVGISSSIVHFTTVICLVAPGWLPPLRANIIAFLIAFCVSFFGHRYWTFENTTRGFGDSLPRFFSVAVLSFALNESFYWYLLHRLQMYYPVALIIVLTSVSALTFFLSKFWAFHSRKK